MLTGRRIARIGAVVGGVVALVAFAACARADNISCDPQDLWNDFSNAWQDAGTCVAACDDGAGCPAAFLIAGAIATAKAGGDQNAVNTFCTDVQNAADDIPTIVGDLRSIGVPDSVVNSVSSVLSSVSSPLAAAQCACEEVNDIGGLIDAAASCVEAGVCAATELFGGACGCTDPPTTVAGNCSPNLANCGHWFYDEDCNDPKNYNDQLCQCERADVITTGSGTDPPIVKINTPGGTEIIQGNLSCGASWSCFCPAPMTLQQTCDGAEDPTCGNNINLYYCACPDGTHPDPTGKFVCLCDTSNQPANFNRNSFEPMCPACATGQVQWDGKCVAACAQNDVRTPDGSCCNPDKVTYCGQCCPPGMTPDPALGTCTPPPPPQQTQ